MDEVGGSEERPEEAGPPQNAGGGSNGFVVGEPPRRGLGRTVHVALVVGVLAVAAGAVFAVRSLGGSDDGGGTPETAARGFFAAVADEDVLGVLESLLPSERDLFKGPLVSASEELGRLRVLSTDLDLSKISGIDLSLEDLELSTDQISDGLAVVRLTGGTSRVAVQPQQLPLGSFVRDLAGEALRQAPPAETEDLSDDDTAFATVRDGDRWYVSLWYSIAEAARREAGAPPPALGRGLAPRGAASGEAAVEEFLRAFARLDVRRLIELLPPDEARALRDYAPIFLTEAEAGAAEARTQFRAEISKLELSSRLRGDEALVKIEDMRFRVAAADGSVGIAYDGDCVRLTGEVFVPFIPGGVLCEGDRPAFAVPELPTKDVDLHFVAVQSGGSWYVSPMRTLLDGFVSVLRAMRPADLETIRDFFTGQAREETFSSEGSFSSEETLTAPAA